MLMEVFHSINLKFYEKARYLQILVFLVYSELNGGNSSVKNKMLKNG